MAGFSSLDDLINEMTTNGKFKRIDWNKNFLPTTAAVAGEWHCLLRGAGNPGADSIINAGTNLTFQSLSDNTPNAGGIQHGGDVAPDTKHILNASAFTAAATTAPGILMLVDLLGWHRVTSVTTTSAQSTVFGVTFTANAGTDIITHTGIDISTASKVRLTTTTTLPAGLSLATDYWTVRQSSTTSKLAASRADALAGTTIDITDAGTGTHTVTLQLPRYTDGAGVQAFFYNSNATALGAGTPNLSLDYTNSEGTASRATPTVLPIGKTAAANGLILYSGTGAGKYGPFMPLAAGDGGIRSIQTIRNSTSYVSGEYAVMYCKPLLTLPITTLGVASERDLLNQVPSLPKIEDGACLAWLWYSGAATPTNSAIAGHLDVAWG